MKVRENWVMVDDMSEDGTPKMNDAGLFVVQTDMDVRVMQTRVLAIGPEVTQVKVGDDVLMDQFGGTAHEGVIFVREPEIYAIVTD